MTPPRRATSRAPFIPVPMRHGHDDTTTVVNASESDPDPEPMPVAQCCHCGYRGSHSDNCPFK
ncbi:hypothetical protein OG21DRAFT_1505156 [Imleria badia]|nr:hypothetical protein OG21DRAFT_1505156 [Imleria badia]